VLPAWFVLPAAGGYEYVPAGGAVLGGAVAGGDVLRAAAAGWEVRGWADAGAEVPGEVVCTEVT
jgi:hypothetical protein